MEEEYISKQDGFSIKDIILSIKSVILYLKPKWIKLILFLLLGCMIGFFYAKRKPVLYNANLSFVVEDTKQGGGSLVALAGQFGLDFGGAASSSLLYGDNLIMFLKSYSLIKEVLLSPYDSVKDLSLADKYLDIYGLRQKWDKKNQYLKGIRFSPTDRVTTRVQDSILQILSDKIVQSELSVERPEKKASFIFVKTKMKDELLSKFFCERLVDKSIEKFIYAKTKRQSSNVQRLQKRADSLQIILNNKTFFAASKQEELLDVNPASKTVTVKLEVSTRDKLILNTIYAEVIKNLEIAKMQLNQETPTILLVDNVELPLNTNKTSKLLYTGFFGFIFFLIGIAYFLFKRILN